MPEDNEPRFRLIFYPTAAGNQPDLDWIRSQPPEYKKRIGADLQTIQFGFPDQLPRDLVKYLRDRVYECRTDLPGRNIARILFCVNGDELVVLNAFIKKMQKTPDHEIEKALNRKRELGL